MANFPLLGEKKWTDKFRSSSIKLEPIRHQIFQRNIFPKFVFNENQFFGEKIDLFEEPKTKSKFARKKSACHIILEQTVEDFFFLIEKRK